MKPNAPQEELNAALKLMAEFVYQYERAKPRHILGYSSPEIDAQVEKLEVEYATQIADKLEAAAKALRACPQAIPYIAR